RHLACARLGGRPMSPPHPPRAEKREDLVAAEPAADEGGTVLRQIPGCHVEGRLFQESVRAGGEQRLHVANEVLVPPASRFKDGGLLPVRPLGGLVVEPLNRLPAVAVHCDPLGSFRGSARPGPAPSRAEPSAVTPSVPPRFPPRSALRRNAAPPRAPFARRSRPAPAEPHRAARDQAPVPGPSTPRRRTRAWLRHRAFGSGARERGAPRPGASGARAGE